MQKVKADETKTEVKTAAAKANAKMGLNESVNEFVRKYRKPIFITFGVLVLALLGTVGFLSLSDVMRKKAISRVEEYTARYEALRFTINEEASAPSVDSLLADIEPFAKKTSGYAGGRAWSIIAGIYADRKKWPESEEAWKSAAQTASQTYLAPIAYFNAAVAAEEQGKTAEAVALYTQAATHEAAFPAAARAQFAVGRLEESLSNTEAALEAYRAVLSLWPYDTVWTNLAHSRIIAIETSTN